MQKKFWSCHGKESMRNGEKIIIYATLKEQSTWNMLTINQLICLGRDQSGAHNVLKLWLNVLKSREYACLFQQEHQKNLIRFYAS
jgi:hypothetical protein